MSTEYCVSPPWPGEFITVRTDTALQGQDWQRVTARLSCEKEEHYFYQEDLHYPAHLEVDCVPGLLFGGNFPYWEVPGLDYPHTTELYCVNARICRDFYELRNKMDALGFMDNFDGVNSLVDDTFQYFCSMEGQRGEKLIVPKKNI